MEPINPFDTCETCDEIDELLDLVFPQANASAETGRMFLAEFVDARLANLNWSAERLAAALGREQAFVERLLLGTLPPAQLTDGLLVQLASALDYDTNLLRILLGREITPAPDSAAPEADDAPRQTALDMMQEIEKLLDRLHDLTALLMRESGTDPALDPQQLHQYGCVLQQMDTIISRHKAESRLRLDIRRIIHFIRDTV